MSAEAPGHSLAAKTVLYDLSGTEAVAVRRDVEYAPGLTLDLYLPPGPDAVGHPPIVVLVAGYPDPGFERLLGRKFKEIGSSTSWGRLLAASGMAAAAYTNREPARDLSALLGFLRTNGAELRVDGSRIGLWAASGSVPLALWALMEPGGESLRCAALCYGYMLDLDGSSLVADAARTFRFANPAAGRPMADLPAETPLLVARAGQDETPGLNETIDRFVARALSRNLPLTLVNHPAGPHAFDLFDGGATTRQVIGRILEFLRSALGLPQ